MLIEFFKKAAPLPPGHTPARALVPAQSFFVNLQRFATHKRHSISCGDPCGNGLPSYAAIENSAQMQDRFWPSKGATKPEQIGREPRNTRPCCGTLIPHHAFKTCGSIIRFILGTTAPF